MKIIFPYCLVKQNSLKRHFIDGLVWTEGMEKQMEADEVEDLAGLFTHSFSSQNIPPIPSVSEN